MKVNAGGIRNRCTIDRSGASDNRRTLPLKLALGARLRRSCDHIKGSRRKKSPSSASRWREVQKTMNLFGQSTNELGRDHNRPEELSEQWVELRGKIELRTRVRQQGCISPKRVVRRPKPQRPRSTLNAEGKRAIKRSGLRSGDLPPPYEEVVFDDRMKRAAERRAQWDRDYDERMAAQLLPRAIELVRRPHPGVVEEVTGTSRERIAAARRRGALRRRGR